LLLLNTEMPFHRPPWIPTFRIVFKTPWLRRLSTVPLGLLLRSAAFRRSSMAYGSCFDDVSLLDADFFDCFLEPLLRSRRRRAGHARYLAGIDWHLIDGLRELHRTLKQPVRLVWGVNDTTFPVGLAKVMSREFADSRGLREIEKAKLLVHEEQPALVAQEAVSFFTEPRSDISLSH
jgi:pimeloyl-ACP methyl ester carboxylesterase